MKLQYFKILLCFILLNILVTLYHAHNKNKPSITLHHIQTNRSLCECDIQSSNYDKDAEMKSVKENFDRRTSQRFEEYEEHMKQKRQKRKGERDKKTQEIIEKDKMDKSLAEKLEKGCLMCGCGLGGVAASVGLFGGLGIYGWKSVALATAKEAGAAQGSVAGEAARVAEGIKAVIEGLNSEFGVSTLGVQKFGLVFDATNYNNVTNITEAVHMQYQSTCLPSFSGTGPIAVAGYDSSFCSTVTTLPYAPEYVSRQAVSMKDVIRTSVETIVSNAKNSAGEAAKKAIEDAIKDSTAAVDAKYIIFQNAIIASVVALLIIVMVMLIIYLFLRYRRKKKMNKKAQYTKLLNQ
ncbi:rifin [Plasmodium reichenowi]|uniref:Rifin n=1 Tax=Plasmodium reichenowi TaxID=5854 RepID=A0A060RQQ0_PLARE|nr:rifin [Plasmodium reichenowi]